MRRSVVLIGLGGLALLGWLGGGKFGGRRLPAGFAASARPSTVRSALTSRAFRFVRDIRARLGERELAAVRLRGRLWVRTHPNDDSLVSLVKIDQVESRAEKFTEELPWIRIEWGAGNQTPRASAPRIWVSDARADSEAGQAAIRFARDLVDQYRFDATTDLQGNYTAQIRTIDARHFEKTKQTYLDEPYRRAQIISSRHRLALDAERLPVEVEGLEQISLGEEKFAVRSRMSYRIQFDSTLADAWAGESALAWNEAQAAKDPAVPTARQVRADASLRSLVSTPALEQLLATLQSAGLRGTAERLAWFRQAVRRINAEPGALDSVRKLLPQLRERRPDFSLLVGALASSVQPDAHRELIEVYRDDTYPSSAHQLIMNAWVATDAPLSPETTQFLVEQVASPATSSDQNQSAWLALGAQAQKTSGSEISAQLMGLLVQKLGQAVSEADTLGALDAMGNAGAPGLLPYIQTYLANSDAPVRAHAYLALRLIPGSEVLALIQAGAADPSGEVQNSAQLSLALRRSAID